MSEKVTFEAWALWMVESGRFCPAIDRLPVWLLPHAPFASKNEKPIRVLVTVETIDTEKGEAN